MPKAAVKLRGHHLLCMLGFVGKGYTPQFIEQFDQVVGQLNAGAHIQLVTGKDDLCAALHDGNGPLCDSGIHCLNESVTRRDKTAIAAVAKALNLPLTIGGILELTAAHIALLRQAFAAGTLRQACEGCEWHELCSDIAKNEFKDVRLMPQRH